MKNNIFATLILATFFILNGCQSPDDLTPSTSRLGINSITATFDDGTGSFVGYASENSDEIVITIPYYYPESSNNPVTESMLSKMRVSANLDDNVLIEPSILFFDLNSENIITVVDQKKERKTYRVRGDIRKSSNSLIEEFALPSLGLSGVINETTKTISLVAVGTLDPAKAAIRLSYHATISPDPTTVDIDYNNDVTFVVTAHDGVTTSTYTVKKEIPAKLPYGIRSESAKIMFAKKLNADLGITTVNMTGGIAATNDYVVINTRNENSIYINAKTGDKIGTISLSNVGSLANFYNTADDDGNLLICNLAPSGGTFKVWKQTSIPGTQELFIDWTTSGSEAIGRKLSIQGSITDNAIITAPLLVGTAQRFARWTVVGGVLTSQIPEIITMSGLTKGWTTNADLIYTSNTDLTSDFFVASYSDNTFAWVNGVTNVVRKKLDVISTNYIPNAIDYKEFNNAKYVTLNWVNSFTWGAADAVWLLDVSNDIDFEGNLETKTSKAVVWESDRDKYGGKALGVANGNGTGDVAITTSSDGFYLYLYFMFTNGYVVGVQFDCIDM